MAKYNSQQRIEMIEFLQSKPGQHVTVNEIANHFSSLQIQIGLTTIYRHLNRMVEKGIVKKFYIDGKQGSCFEYINPRYKKTNDKRFHLKCKNCDQLIHFECEEVKKLQEHIIKEHNFIIDPVRTVFYGICKSCKEKKNSQ